MGTDHVVLSKRLRAAAWLLGAGVYAEARQLGALAEVLSTVLQAVGAMQARPAGLKLAGVVFMLCFLYTAWA